MRRMRRPRRGRAHNRSANCAELPAVFDQVMENIGIASKTLLTDAEYFNPATSPQ